MNTRRISFAILLTAAFTIFAAAQKPVKFTSAYTSLDKGCKTLRGGPGQDDAYLCKGVGGYKVRVYYSAAATHITAERAGSDTNSPVAMLDLGFDLSSAKLEWRLANGRPFAVILRVPVYGDAAPGEYFGKVTGRQLIIIGLAGYNIDEKIDAKMPSANARAREIADAAFAKKQ